MGGMHNLTRGLDVDRTPPTQRHGAFRWDARIKIVLLLAVLLLNSSLAQTPVSAILALIGTIFLLWSRPSFRRIRGYLLAPCWATGLLVMGYAMGFGLTPVAHVGSLILYREGLLHGGALAVRVACAVSWLTLTFATTPFTRVLTALHWLRIPAILLETLALMYRYAFAMGEEFARMRRAARARGGCRTRREEMRAIGRICAQIFLRAFDRSERIYGAMLARGGD